MDSEQLVTILGNTDLYLIDQILKGRFSRDIKILDAGCGEGRNAEYFIRSDHAIFGVDRNSLAIQMLRMRTRTINPNYDVERFQVSTLEDLFFHSGAFDFVICSAVLHFAKDHAHFDTMWSELIRVLKPGGLFWLRCCTDAGHILEDAAALGEGRYRLPDGSERYVLTSDHLNRIMATSGLTHVEAPKSVLVHGQRAMGVFLFKKA